MNRPIESAYPSGVTLYAVVHNPNGQVWDNFNKIFETYNSAHWALYAIPLTEQAGSGYYRGTYPPEIEDLLTTEAIYVQAAGSPALGDQPPIGLGMSQGQNVGAVMGDNVAASNLQKVLGAEKQGLTITGTLSNTQATTDLTDTTDDVYVGRAIIFTSGPAIRQAATIRAYDASTAKLTFTPLASAPVAGDAFIII